MTSRSPGLQTRILLIATAVTLVAALASWLMFRHIAERIIEQWGQRVAEIQVGYDSTRLLGPLERETVLARQLAESAALRSWFMTPADPQRAESALRELEAYRRHFSDRSYFAAILENGAYFHNNARDEYAGRQFRYTLKPADPADAWFYRLIEQGRDFHINVNPDVELGVTKIWIDVLVRDGDRILGIVGTGMALDAFLNEVVDRGKPGITTLFVDHSGAIQLHRDMALIDYASIVKPEGQKNTVELLFSREDDRAQIRDLLRQARASPAPDGPVHTAFVELDGKRHLAGVAYLPSIDWYEITLLDLDTLMPVSSLAPIAVVLVLTLVVTLLVLGIAVRRLVLEPLAALEAAVLQAPQGALDQIVLPRATGELGRLIAHFQTMASAIHLHTRELEQKVAERTEALQRLARTDPLTELLNRRGMTALLADIARRAEQDGTSFGLLWMDIDRFKELNDRYGHARGDQALTRVAAVLKESLRPGDRAARWGGDEFLVVLTPGEPLDIEQIGERIRARIAEGTAAEVPLTVSIGACLARPGEGIDAVLQRADEALYAAKATGRNALVGPSAQENTQIHRNSLPDDSKRRI